MGKGRKTRVGLALLCGALALAAALVLTGALLSAAALWPTRRVMHTSAPESAPQPASTLPVTPGAAGSGSRHLVIRESAVVAAGVMGPGRFEYDDQLGDDVRIRILALRARGAERAREQANSAVAPFGYRLESRFDDKWQRTLYDVYRQDEGKPLLAGLASIWPVSVNSSGTDFLLAAENTPTASMQYVLVRNGDVDTWDPGVAGPLPPAYVGDALARVRTTGFPTITYQVELGGQAVHTGTAVVYTGTVVAMGASMPLRSFTTWDDHWVLEVNDHLIMDGVDINQAHGYDAAFGFTRIGGRSFYFFEQDAQVRISYGDQAQPNSYTQVFHNQCCEASIHNVESGPGAVWFHALKDGTWYFVEATLDEQR